MTRFSRAAFGRGSLHPNSSRGQVTVFIILGLLIVLLAALALFTVQRPAVERVPELARPVAQLVQSCLERSIVDGALLIGRQGGYLVPPSDALVVGNGRVARGVSGGSLLVPSRDAVARELGSFIEERLPDCADVAVLAAQGLSVSFGIPRVEVVVGDDDVRAKVIWPVSVSAGGTSVRVSDFVASQKLSLGELHTYAVVAASGIASSDGIDISLLSGLPVAAAVVPVSRSSFIVVLRGPVTADGREQFFSFGVVPGRNLPPILVAPGELRVRAGSRAVLLVSATDPEGSAVIFGDDSPMLDIGSASGEAIFIPRVPGVFPVRITATDTSGLSARAVVEVVVS